jgi:hypothetical protein
MLMDHKMKKNKVVVLLFICLSFIYSSPFAHTVSKNLFKIKRNKNANVVMYDVNLNADGSICKSAPIDSYWVLKAENGQREEISAFEKKAYGYMTTYKTDKTEGYYDLVLKAVPSRAIKIVRVNEEVKPEIEISNKRAYLSTVYVFANNNFMPKIQYLILTGTDINTGVKITEKINPK